jgi:titin
MKTLRSLPVFFSLLALLFAVPARAAFPLAGTVSVAGSGGGLDAANAIAQDASGNLYVAGSLNQGAGDDIWVAKYSPALVLLSSYTYDKAGFSDMAWGVGVDTTSGGVFAAGFISSASAASSKNIWIAKFDSSLVLQSSVSVNGSASDEDAATGMRVYGGALFVVGHSSVTGGRAHWVARYDTNLVLIASSTFVQYTPYGFDVLPTASGNVFVAGSRCPNSVTSPDAWIGKYSSSLVLLTSATVNGSSSNTDEYRRLAEDGSGGVYAVGFLNTATAADRFIQHYDTNLVRVSSALVNGPGNSNEYLADILVTSSGTLLVSGDQSDTAGLGGRNALIAEYTTGYALVSITTFSSSGSGEDHANALLIGANQDVYVAGWVTGADQDAWIARFSTNPSNGMYPGCAVTKNVGAGQTYSTISSAVAALPATLTGHSCVVIHDGATYAEQVTVQNFTMNGSSIAIFADPGSGLTPVISPPASSTAAFRISNASVTVSGFNILGTNAMPYGVQASSAYVTISSVNIDSGGKIAVAGVSLSSYSSLSYSSITVQNAYGLIVSGTNSSVSNSTATNAGAGFKALWLSNASSNTITWSHLSNSAGTGAYLDTGSGYNTISQSTMAGNGAALYGLWIVGATYNTVAQSDISNPAGTGARLDTGSNRNTISQSTMTSNAAGFYALLINAASSNTVTQSYVFNPSGDGLSLVSNYNTISQSTLESGSGGDSAVFLSAAHFNTITQSYVTNLAGNAANVFSSNYNTISLSTLTSNGVGNKALYLFTASSNTVTQSYITNPAGDAVHVFSNSNSNTISQSTLTSNTATSYALYLQSASSNKITQSYISNPSGYAAVLFSNANSNTISQSTMTSGAAGYDALHLDGVSSSTIDRSYIQGSTAVYITGSTGTVFSTSELAADSALGNALTLTGGCVSLSVASSTLRGGASGRGLLLDLGNSGVVSIGSVTVMAATRGLEISTQAAGFTLAVDSVTFRGLSAGATAIHFLGGTVVSTLTLANFEDANIGANVSGEALGTASRITMNAHRGTRRGQPYENDPNSLVYWQDLVVAASNFTGTVMSTTSIQWSWDDNSDNELGFRVMAGTANVSGNLAINATTWLQTGLGVNTSSGSMLVQAFTASTTSVSGSVTRYSLADVPSGLAPSNVFLTSATVSWTAGNPAGTVFQLERSSGVGFALVVSTTLAVYTNTGLSPGVTYYYRVRALNADSVLTAYSSSATFVTLAAGPPAAPSAFAAVAQSSTSVLWSWTDNSSDETGFRVKLGATNLSGDLASNTTTWLQTGMAVNSSTGSLLVQAFSSTGTADSGSLSRYSLAAVPVGLAASNVYQTSMTVSWTASNPPGTIFELDRSSGSGFALLLSTDSASYADVGLTNATTYFYRVRAISAEAIATAYASSITVVTDATPVPGAPTGFAGAAQSATSILWSWSDNSNNEDGYRVLSGTISLSGDLAVDVTTWLQTGLSTNTVSGPLFVRGFNAGGGLNSGTASRTTLAAVPSALASSGVFQSSATLSWNAGGNPGGTTFQLERSTGTGYGLQFAGPATYYFDAYLTPSTTYFYRVHALNGESVATADTSTITVVALPAPPIPGSAGTPVGTALGTSSASWTWVLAAGATNYYLLRPSDNSYLGSSSSGPFVQTALSPNTAYGLRAAGVNLGGTGPLSPSATVYTLASAPTGAAVSSVAATSQLVSWSLAGNPAATLAQLERSTSPAAYTALASGMVTSYADADLLGCTTYYYRVRNLNGDGLSTAYSTFSGVTANTIPSPPPGLTASANAGGTVSLSWGLSATEGVTGYRLYGDAGTGTVSYAAPLAVLSSTETSFTTGVLASSAAYTFALRTAHRCGVVEATGALAMSGAASAPADVRAAIKEPDSGRRISGNRVTILGELIAGTPSDVQQVLFQYKLAASTAWIDVDEAEVTHTNPDFSFPYFVHADVTALAAGSYDLRAIAYNRAGVPDPAPPAVRVVVDPISPDISETVAMDGTIKKDQTISNTVTSVVDTCGAGALDPAVRVTIPPGAVNSTTATVSVTANPMISTAAPKGQTMIGSSIKINLSNGQSALNGTAAITLSYPDTVMFPSLLQIYYLNEATGKWSRDFATTVDTAHHTVSGNTSHFSTFVVMLGTAFAPDLDSVQVYPVPFKPNGPNPDEGRPFTLGNASSGIIFASLASGSEIRIYTLSGRMVASLDTPTIAGAVRWDVRNQDGRDVASGAYFAVISAAGHKAVVKKLVIIR